MARHYDELDRFYRRLWGEHLHHGLFDAPDEDPQRAAGRMVDMVAELAGVSPGLEVCDVGCGYGATGRVLAGQYGARVIGITLSRAQLEEGRKKVPPGMALELVQGDWLAGGFAPEAFDVVVAIESLAHMTDKAAFFAEAARTLRPGGRLVICAWACQDESRPLVRRFLLEPICREGALPSLPSEADCRRWLAAHGLQLLTAQDLSRRVRPTWAVSSRRLTRALFRDRELRSALRDRGLANRSFALSVLRIRIAYRLGAMRYLVLSARKP